MRAIIRFGLYLTAHMIVGSAVLAVGDSQFPLMSFSDFERAYPPPPEGEDQLEISAPGFSTVTKYEGKSRALSRTQRKVLASLALREPENRKMFSLYEGEVEVRQEGKSIWIPAQKELLRLMREELTQGESMVLYLRFFGRIGSKPFYLCIHYEHGAVPPYHDSEIDLPRESQE